MELKEKESKIIILSGKARSGKDEVAKIIKEYYSNQKVKKLSYAYYLKQYIKNISNWDGNDDNKPRDLLQTIGIDLIKNKIDDKLLINRVIEDIKVYSYFYDVIIITDARLLDEIEDIKKSFNNVICIRINRDMDNQLSTEQKNHITETHLDNYCSFDYVIENNDDFIDLKNKVKEVLEDINE